MTTTARPARPPRPQIVLSVIATTKVTPHLVRVTAGGPGFAEFVDNGMTDKYIKMLFAKPELGLEPPYDMADLRETLAPDDLPVTRTYTVRGVDPVAGTIDIDFVVHGDEGVAGPWAAAAQPGDPVVFMGPGGGFRPDPAAVSYLFAGDESALPAIAAALEALPADATGIAFLEAYDEADVIDLAAPEDITVHWLLRGDDVAAGADSLLPDAVSLYEWPQGRVQVFAHGEREAMKALRDILLVQREVPRTDLSLSGYWAYGRTEDRFQAEKREPIGVVLPS